MKFIQKWTKNEKVDLQNSGIIANVWYLQQPVLNNQKYM